MTGGGLHDPLGTDRPPGTPRNGPPIPLIALVGVLIGFACLFATATLRNGGERGEPRAVVEIGQAQRSDPAPAPSAPLASTDSARPAGPANAAPSSDQEVEIENGVRVVRLRHDAAGAAHMLVKVPGPASADPSALPIVSSGPLLRAPPDGRQVVANVGAAVSGQTVKPWVSVVVEAPKGDPNVTAFAPTDWPVDVTWGVPTERTDVSHQVDRARAAGHEVVLMLAPLEREARDPAAPASTGSDMSSTRASLHALLSRVTGCAGVVVDTAIQDRATVTAEVAEATAGGLYVVDDAAPAVGATPPDQDPSRSMPRADLVLTGQPEAAALDRLATLARANGSAIGLMPASPRSLAALSRFAASLNESGVALVPLAAIVSRRGAVRTRPMPVAAP